MNQPKWTKGPWKIASNQLDGRLQFSVLDCDGYPVGGADARDSVKAGFGKDEDLRSRTAAGQEEAWANATLWAAAPDEDGELSWIVNWFDSIESERTVHPCDYLEIKEWRIRAKAALAKARGES